MISEGERFTPSYKQLMIHTNPAWRAEALYMSFDCNGKVQGFETQFAQQSTGIPLI